MEAEIERGNRNGAIKEAARYLVYASLAYLVAELLKWSAFTDNSEAKFPEYSLVEYSQSFLLLISCYISFRFYLSKNGHPYQYIFMLIAALCAMAFIREQDIYFERIFGHGTWPIPVFAIVVLALYKSFRAQKAFLQEIASYMKTKSYAFFMFATITIFVFARLFGRTMFWKAVMEDQYFRSVKNVAEESLELYGYLFLLFAVIELVIHTSQGPTEAAKKPKEKSLSNYVEAEHQSQYLKSLVR